MNENEFEIEKNIPMPLKRHGGTTKLLELYEKMEIGDSVLMEPNERLALSVALRSEYKDGSLRTVARKTKEGKMRVWKTK